MEAAVRHTLPTDWYAGDHQSLVMLQRAASMALTPEQSDDLSSEARAMALLAWRATHRSPRFLQQRRVVTKELLALGQELRRPALQVDAAVYLAVDAIESADRQLYDKALGVARWVAERQGSVRLSWRADTLAARAPGGGTVGECAGLVRCHDVFRRPGGHRQR